jgi:hypothetical protein
MQMIPTILLTAFAFVALAAVVAHGWAHWTIRNLDRPGQPEALEVSERSDATVGSASSLISERSTQGGASDAVDVASVSEVTAR